MAAKLELRIDLGPKIVGEFTKDPGSNPNQLQRPPISPERRVKSTGSKPNPIILENEMPARVKISDAKVEVSARKAKEPGQNNDVTPKTILRNRDTPNSKSRAKRESKNGQNAITPGAVTIPSPLRGDVDSPLKPFKYRRQGMRSSLMRLTTPATTSQSNRSDDRRAALDHKIGAKAFKELFSAISMGTRMLEFKDMLEVKVAVGMARHVSHLVLEDLDTFEKVIEELSMLWKIHRVDIDLLEYLLGKVGMFERFSADVEKYKSLVNYSELSASSEREVTTIISSLHNLLQGAEEASGTYTTMCFLHYGDVYHFSRSRLFCMKNDLAQLLTIHPTQLTYLAKVPANGSGYVTVFQMPCSVSKKLVLYARKNHDVLMSIGLKGIQITGSDGLRYTQSMGYLQDKVPVSTQTAVDDVRISSRNAKTAPTMSSFPPLGQMGRSSVVRPSLRAEKSAHGSTTLASSHSNDVIPGADMTSPPAPRKIESSVDLNAMDPNEAKFERRVRLMRDTLTELSKPESDDLVNVLLEQIEKLHKNINLLKKDLKDKTRELNGSQNFVSKAEKEIKNMEMRLEAKAHQISETNQHLLKRVKKLMNENTRLKDDAQRMDAELDIHRQIEKDSRFGNMIRTSRLSRLQAATV